MAFTFSAISWRMSKLVFSVISLKILCSKLLMQLLGANESNCFIGNNDRQNTGLGAGIYERCHWFTLSIDPHGRHFPTFFGKESSWSIFYSTFREDNSQGIIWQPCHFFRNMLGAKHATGYFLNSWWHQDSPHKGPVMLKSFPCDMETISALLVLCERNPLVTGR